MNVYKMVVVDTIKARRWVNRTKNNIRKKGEMDLSDRDHFGRCVDVLN